MPEVIGIRFKSCGKIYDFEIDGLAVKIGDRVVVESDYGLSIGNVVEAPHTVDSGDREIRKVLRVAGEDDLRQKKENEQFERDAKAFCIERVASRGLQMKLVCTEATLDRKRIVFYFTADGRIDFRELVKDLASKFKTRIEMRQIGVRDKAKMVGGLGICGKELCCRLFLTTFEPISIKMAKQQDLALNTGKLSGICGRLMCCLGYEYGSSGPDAPAYEKPAPAQRKAEAKEPVEEREETVSEDISCCPIPEASGRPAAASRQEGGAPGKKPEGSKKFRRKRKFKKRQDKDA